MWFKNLCIFRLHEKFTLSAEQINEKLMPWSFRAAGPHELFSFGWSPPIETASKILAYNCNHFIMLCAKKDQKVLPNAVINEKLREKILDLENTQNRKLNRNEKTALKDDIIFELLPKAFSFSKKTYAYIDSKNGWLIVDSASWKKAEDLLSYLRKSLNTLPATPIRSVDKPSTIMTSWLMGGQIQQQISIENECELSTVDEDGGIIRCKRHDLSAPEIRNHILSGKEAIKLAVTWNDRLAFMIDNSLAIKRLRFLDFVQNQANAIETLNEADRFDADFSIMSLEIADFLSKFLELFGGELKEK